MDGTKTRLLIPGRSSSEVIYQGTPSRLHIVSLWYWYRERSPCTPRLNCQVNPRKCFVSPAHDGKKTQEQMLHSQVCVYWASWGQTHLKLTGRVTDWRRQRSRQATLPRTQRLRALDPARNEDKFHLFPHPKRPVIKAIEINCSPVRQEETVVMSPGGVWGPSRALRR